MTYQIINIATEEDLELINNFVKSVKFNTKEDHIPLHDPLFSNSSVNFDITTYGDMPKNVVDIFKKYCDAIKETVTKISGIEYNPPILGKSYIMRFNPQNSVALHYDKSRPDNVFRSIINWNNLHDGGIIKFKNYKIAKELVPGDCLIFPENKEYTREITTIEKNSMFISDFWNAPVGQSPYPGLKYEEIYWGNPLWEDA